MDDNNEITFSQAPTPPSGETNSSNALPPEPAPQIVTPPIAPIQPEQPNVAPTLPDQPDNAVPPVAEVPNNTWQLGTADTVNVPNKQQTSPVNLPKYHSSPKYLKYWIVFCVMIIGSASCLAFQSIKNKKSDSLNEITTVETPVTPEEAEDPATATPAEPIAAPASTPATTTPTTAPKSTTKKSTTTSTATTTPAATTTETPIAPPAPPSD